MADNQEDRTDRAIPWTIKGIVPEARNAAIAAARRERQTLGEWMARAIRAQVQADHQQTRAPTVVLPNPVPEVRPRADLAEIERIVTMTAALSGAGAPPPKAVSRAAYGLLRDALAEMRHPTPGQTGSRRSPTGAGQGQTPDAESPIVESAGPTQEADGQTGAAQGPTESAIDREFDQVPGTPSDPAIIEFLESLLSKKEEGGKTP